ISQGLPAVCPPVREADPRGEPEAAHRKLRAPLRRGAAEGQGLGKGRRRKARCCGRRGALRREGPMTLMDAVRARPGRRRSTPWMLVGVLLLSTSSLAQDGERPPGEE